MDRSSVAKWIALACMTCGRRTESHPLFWGCPTCGGALTADLPVDFIRWSFEAGHSAAGSIAPLMLPDLDPITSLGEGGTPMLAANGLAEQHGFGALFVKNEARNPTGSYKDRLNAVAVAAATKFAITRVATSSTGNQAVSLAAYAASAGLRCDAFLPPTSPLQAVLEVERLGGHPWVTAWDQRMPTIRALVASYGYGYVGRNFPRPLANPYGLEGYKSIAYEIVRDLGGRPSDVVLMPSCGGDGIYGTWRGFNELFRAGIIPRQPRIIACGLSAAPSVATAWRDRLDHVLATDTTPSIALSLIDAQGGDHALSALYESGGAALSLHDEHLLQAMATLGALGVLAEPAGAAALGAVTNHLYSPTPDEVAVVVMTGYGGRWPAALSDLPDARRPADPLSAVLASLDDPAGDSSPPATIDH
jgi:threonine synthase